MGAAVGKSLALVAWGLVLGGVSPLLSAQQYTYDSVGRLTTIVFSNGAKTQYTYDRAGNRLTETYVAPSMAQLDKPAESIAGTAVRVEGPLQDEAVEQTERPALAGSDAAVDDAPAPRWRESDASAAGALPGRESAPATLAGRR
jgi:YD repeat-containing protein